MKALPPAPKFRRSWVCTYNRVNHADTRENHSVPSPGIQHQEPLTTSLQAGLTGLLVTGVI